MAEGATLIKNILISYIVIAAVSVLMYIPKLVQFFYMFKKPVHKKATEKRKISLIIPALDESEIIGDLFNSILKQDYGREFFDVNVVVKDARDPTIAIAEKLGFSVFIVPDQTCKGEALDGFFKQLSEETFNACDAFVIVDADAVLESDYVTELNHALEHDYDIYLTRKFIKNYLGDRKKRTIFSNCSALIYPMLDNLGNTYKTLHGIPLNMCGQGMMIRRSVIANLGGWPYRTLTEDYELKLDSVLRGFTSMYYPYAIIYTEEVLHHKDSYTRRLRWVTGYSQCDRMYKKQVKEKIRAERGRHGEWFEFIFALVPPILFAVATVLTMLGGVALTVYYFLNEIDLWFRATILLIVMPFGLMYFILFLYCCLAMIAYRDVFRVLSPGEKAGTLLFAPLFQLEYFPIFIQSRIRARKGMAWQPTKHIEYENGVSIEQEAQEDGDPKEE